MFDKCSFCQDNSTLYDSHYLWGGRVDSIEISIANSGSITVIADVDNNYFTGKCSINYCPICGSKLGGGIADESDRACNNQ